ncbi:hypothetical protein T4B_3160, partial [Trichinella pseudospiralis]
LERRKTSPVGLPTQRGELQCQPPTCSSSTPAGTAPSPPQVQPTQSRQATKPVTTPAADETMEARGLV